MKQNVVLIFVVLAIVACGSSAGDRLLGSSEKASVTPTPPTLQDIQINQTSVLPPYGLRVKADVASLNLRVSSSKDDTENRLEAIQKAVEQISDLVADDDTLTLQYISVSRISSSWERDTSVPYLSESYDSSSVILKLSTDLAGQNSTLLESLIVFNDFLKTLNLPETVRVDALSLEAEISAPETYREQLLAKVYQELAAIQAEYGQAVTFEITGLHSGVQAIPLTDTEYYLYIEPAIVVNEF